MVVAGIYVVGQPLAMRLRGDGKGLIAAHETPQRDKIRTIAGRREDLGMEVRMLLANDFRLVPGLILPIIGVRDNSPAGLGVCGDTCTWSSRRNGSVGTCGRLARLRRCWNR